MVGRITAGVDPDSIVVSPGKCAYITTGAKLPQGANAVVKVRRSDKRANARTDGRAVGKRGRWKDGATIFVSIVRPTIMEKILAIISGDYFCSFEAPEITASEIRGVHYGF